MTNAKHLELLEQAKAHYAADMLIKGSYGDDDNGQFRGCSVGCHLFHIYLMAEPERIASMDDKHRKVAEYYEYPEWLAHLQDTIFEGLPSGENTRWHVQFAEAVVAHKGAFDWDEVYHRVHVGILRVSYRTAGASAEAVQLVLDLHERVASGETVTEEQWSAARSAARSAWSAARSAARAAAESAWSAAESAAFQEIRDVILVAIGG